MVLQIANRVQEAVAAPSGSAAFVTGSPAAGFIGFAAIVHPVTLVAIAVGDTVPYSCVDASNNWEVGLGTYGTGTLTRTTVYSSSNAGAAVSFSGTVTIWVDLSALGIFKPAILGGTIDGASIGAATPATGAFTTLAASTSLTSTSLTLAGVSQSPYATAPLFGTGADGSVTISSGTATLGRDMHYLNLTMSGSAKIIMNGWRIFVSNKLDIGSAAAGALVGLAYNGANASGSVGGVGTGINGYGGTFLRSNNSGAAGGNGSATTGASTVSIGTVSAVQGGVGGKGGAGGTAVSAGGAAGSAAVLSLSALLLTTPTPNLQPSPINVTTLMVSNAVGTSGGGGGGDGTNAGGGGGATGGMPSGLGIFARIIDRGTNTTAGIFYCVGGAGGNGAAAVSGNAAGGGAGGGGPGGFVYIITENLLGSVIPNAIDVSGAAGGVGGAGLGTGKGGNGGSGGGSGNVQISVLNQTGSTTSIASGSTASASGFNATLFNQAGTAGGTTTTTTGGTSGAGATFRVGL